MTDMTAAVSTGAGLRRGTVLLLRFAWIEAKSCGFAVAVFTCLAVTSVVPLPIPRYDALLICMIVVTAVLWRIGWETGREVAVIAGFHLVGLALELFKVRVGSWSYPEEALTRVAGVPLYSGFMYAAVGSYICQAWRRLDLRVTGYRPVALAVLAVAVYANFFTHHFLPDVRWILAALLLVVLRRTWVHFTVDDARLRMPLALAFVLTGFFLWVAENVATFLGAWTYPDQEHVWTFVHASKFGSWSLLVTLSFVLVATVKATEGRLYGDRPRPSVVTSSG
ncbi:MULTISPECIES: DUF817 domain-containing protein [unclassified Solwaraspora]|uniref:DUF817 domain-containing protein n=1 Tax=unclassified Solwaraspora TaxID=2627926 RepID=UPI00259B0BD2|nr:DUF817 domain-containing protein [Solwaraspora sp. WMMA2056]WJK41023.1 DUF817 domain-containing protein [Solwaraspora sp. WMMA2056]